MWSTFPPTSSTPDPTTCENGDAVAAGDEVVIDNVRPVKFLKIVDDDDTDESTKANDDSDVSITTASGVFAVEGTDHTDVVVDGVDVDDVIEDTVQTDRSEDDPANEEDEQPDSAVSDVDGISECL